MGRALIKDVQNQNLVQQCDIVDSTRHSSLDFCSERLVFSKTLISQQWPQQHEMPKETKEGRFNGASTEQRKLGGPFTKKRL